MERNIRCTGCDEQALREHGCPAITECRLVVLEVDGTISVIDDHRDVQRHEAAAK